VKNKGEQPTKHKISEMVSPVKAMHTTSARPYRPRSLFPFGRCWTRSGGLVDERPWQGAA